MPQAELREIKTILVAIGLTPESVGAIRMAQECSKRFNAELHVIHVNIINSSQVAMCAVAGVILFREPLTASLALGVLLTIGGTLLIVGTKAPKEQESPKRTP